MNRRVLKQASLMFLITSLTFGVSMFSLANEETRASLETLPMSSSPVVYVDPTNKTASLGSTFTVKVNITNPSNLYGFDLRFGWGSSVLQYVSRSVKVAPTLPTTALAVSGTYVYAGLNMTPGRIVKIDLSTFSQTAVLELASGEDYVTSLAVDGTYLYAGLLTAPGKVVKIDLTGFTRVSTLTLLANENYITSLVVRGSYLYAGLNTDPGRVARIALATFTRSAVLSLSSLGGENYITSLTVVAGTPDNLYAGTNTAPGRIVKVRLDTFVKVSTLSLSAGENYVTSQAVSGTYLYVGLNTVAGKVTKIDLSTFTKVTTLNLSTGENNVMALAVSGTFLYAGTKTSSGKVVKINISHPTFSRVGALTLSTSEDNVMSLVVDGTNLYAGLNTGPGKIVKIELTGFTKVATRNLEISPLDGVLWAPASTVFEALDQIAGTYQYAAASSAPAPSFNVSGVVFTITFKVLAQAECELYFLSTSLVDKAAALITHSVQEGYFYWPGKGRVPTADFTYSPDPAVINKTATFNAGASNDPDGAGIAKYIWDFGDGTKQNTTTPTTTHIYNQSGLGPWAFTARLNVVDNEGSQSRLKEKAVNAVHPRPVAKFTITPSTVNVTKTVTFNGASSYDPDPAGGITLYMWDFGDGTKQNTTTPTTTHVYALSDTYNPSLIVIDIESLQSARETVPFDVVTIAGDAEGDGDVDVYDLNDFGRAFGSIPQSPNWNGRCDFNDDSTVNDLDLDLLVPNYGKTV